MLSTTVRAKAREARKEAKKLGRQPSLDSTSGGLGEIPMERVTSHLSTTSYLSMDAVSLCERLFFDLCAGGSQYKRLQRQAG